MTDVSELTKNIEQKYRDEFDSLNQQIYALEKQKDNIDERLKNELFEQGKSLNLNDVNFYTRYFEFFVDGCVIKNGINDSHIHEEKLNLITNGFHLSKNKKQYAKSIKSSFLKLSKENKLTFCLFQPKYVDYKNYAGQQSLIGHPLFEFLADYLIDTYSLFCPLAYNFPSQRYKDLKDSCLFWSVIEPNEERTQNKLIVEITEKSIENIEISNETIKALQSDGYHNGFYIQPSVRSKKEDTLKLINY